MQTLSTLYSRDASLATTHLDSDAVCRKKKRWVHLGGPFGCSHHSHQSLFLSCPGVLGSGNLNSRNGFLSNCMKSFSFGPRSCSLGRPFALSLALDQAAVGHEKSERKATSFDALSREGNEEIVKTNENQVEKNESQLVENVKVNTRALARSLQDARTADDVEELFKDLEALPLPVYSSMLRGFGVDKRLDAAFALIDWLKRKSKEHNGFLGPNLFLYNSLLGAVKHSEQFDRIDEVLEDMKEQEIAPNIVTYNTLMSIYLEQGRPGDALDVLGDIEMSGLSPSPITYSTTLLAYKKMNDASGAIEYFVNLREAYEKGDIEKDKIEFPKLEKFMISIFYQVIRQWLVKEDDPTAKILKLFSVMDKARVKPGRGDYERLVWACTRDIHYYVAKELYSRIREIDSNISLSVCNHIIWLMGTAKKWWAALEVYEDLLDKGPKPNNLSNELIISHFNTLLTAARRKGIWRWGVRLLNKMQDKGLRPGTREWNAVLVACSKASETSAAVQIFRRMVEQGEKPTVLSYGALLSALEKGKLYDEALKVWEHMCKVGLEPNLYAYTILASVYAGQGQSEMVDSVLRQMDSSGIEPTVVTYNAIITGCCRNQMGSAALEWFHRMKVRNIKPNEITYDMLIEALSLDGKPRLAFEMYLKASGEGLSLSSRVYDAVVESCLASGMGMDVNALGPRPAERKRKVKVRKNLSEFCNSAELPRRSKPFDADELYASQTQER